MSLFKVLAILEKTPLGERLTKEYKAKCKNPFKLRDVEDFEHQSLSQLQKEPSFRRIVTNIKKLMAHPFLYPIIGLTKKSLINFQKRMDNGEHVLVDMALSDYHETIIDSCAGLVMSQIRSHAEKRQFAIAKKHPCLIVLDDALFYKNKNITNMVYNDRKYGQHPCLVTQSLSNPQIYELFKQSDLAITGNASDADARLFAKECSSQITPDQITALPNQNFIMRCNKKVFRFKAFQIKANETPEGKNELLESSLKYYQKN